MSKFFEELEAQLHDAARAQAEARQPGTDPTRPGRSRLRSWSRAIPVALALAVTAAVVVGVALTLHASSTRTAATNKPRTPIVGSPAQKAVVYGGGGMQVLGTLGHLSGKQQHELSAYVFPAQVKASKRSACTPAPPRPTLSEGTPSRETLSILGVLRRPAARTDLPRVPHASQPLYPIDANSVYVRYVRRALVKDRVSYYIIPAASVVEDPQFSARCRATQVAVLRSETPRIPAEDRSSTLALQARWLALFAHTQPTGGAVCLSDFAASGAGGGTCSTAAEVERSGEMESEGSTLSGIVPDGVATVSLHYPAAKGLPALTVTTGVAGNLFAASVSRMAETGNWPPTITWRSATGQVIKTISTR